jgi:hypothetical protein
MTYCALGWRRRERLNLACGSGKKRWKFPENQKISLRFRLTDANTKRRSNANQQREPTQKDARRQNGSQGDKEATPEQNQQIRQAKALKGELAQVLNFQPNNEFLT